MRRTARSRRASRDSVQDLARGCAALEFRSLRVTWVRLALWSRLWAWAHDRGVTVAFSTMPFTARNVGLRRRAEGRTTPAFIEHGNDVVTLAPTYWFHPYVLAHELGHHLAGFAGDEAEADRRGVRLVKSLLTAEELEVVREEVLEFLEG